MSTKCCPSNAIFSNYASQVWPWEFLPVVVFQEVSPFDVTFFDLKLFQTTQRGSRKKLGLH